MSTPLTIVKLGGSVITHKELEGVANQEVIDRLSRELAEARRSGLKLVVTHGGGSYPHPVAARFRVHEGYGEGGEEKLMGYALTQDAAARINRLITSSLLRHGVPAVSIQPSAIMVSEDGEVKECYLNPLQRMLKLGLVPVLYGDAVVDTRKGFTIVSAEAIIKSLSPLLKPERIVVCVDVDGVYDRYPGGDLIDVICSDNIEKVKVGLGNARGFDVTGGMLHKVSMLYSLATQGYPSIIVNGLKPGLLLKALKGEKCTGTLIKK
ncbi:MAG: hypothetical protein DRJ98_07905 [Thermoprotei archaeon]|nr:MAG: hypothetical protein DRJ98_07905 [Thermoprotei archaeon]